jgi:hypothetical protein
MAVVYIMLDEKDDEGWRYAEIAAIWPRSFCGGRVPRVKVRRGGRLRRIDAALTSAMRLVGTGG